MSTPKEDLDARARQLVALCPNDALRDAYEREIRHALYLAFSLGFSKCLEKQGLPAELAFRAFDA